MQAEPGSPYHRDFIAAVYDAEASFLMGERDVPFYLQEAARSGGTVLEFACGTGRLVLPLARAGYQVTGVDNSEPMLSLARTKLAREPREVRDRAMLALGDMRRFQLESTFALTFIAFNTFVLLATPEDQSSFLQSARRHLRPEGRLIVDIFVPNPEIVARPAGHVTTDPAFEWPEEDALVIRTETVVAKDPRRQTGDLLWTYEVIRRDGTTRKHVVPVRLRYTYPQEMIYLLERNGFRVVELLGGWDREGYDSGRRMIVIAAKTGG